MIALLLVWCGVAIWLALAVGRALADRRHADLGRAGALGNAVAAAAAEAPAARPARGPGALVAFDQIDQVLSELDEHDPRLAKTVLLRWIGGLSESAIADALGVSIVMVENDLRFARHLMQSSTARGTSRATARGPVRGAPQAANCHSSSHGGCPDCDPAA